MTETSSSASSPSVSSPSAIELLSQERISTGYCKVDRLRLRHELFAGGMSGEVVREVVERGHAAAAMLYDPRLDCCVMIEQFRPGAWRAGQDAWLLEIVAGIIEPGESAREVCRREALEEAGVEAVDLFPVYRYLVTPGVCTESIELFAGRVDASSAGGLHGLASEGEDIRVLTMTYDELRQAMEENRLSNATTLIAVQWLLMNRDALRRRWAE